MWFLGIGRKKEMVGEEWIEEMERSLEIAVWKRVVVDMVGGRSICSGEVGARAIYHTDPQVYVCLVVCTAEDFLTTQPTAASLPQDLTKPPQIPPHSFTPS